MRFKESALPSLNRVCYHELDEAARVWDEVVSHKIYQRRDLHAHCDEKVEPVLHGTPKPLPAINKYLEKHLGNQVLD